MSFKRRLLFWILWTARSAGLFSVARLVTKRALRILCYHGGAVLDEHRFSPGTFMTGRTFQRRIDHLVKAGYPVLPLGRALQLMEAEELPACATVITLDDGWVGTYSELYPILLQNRLQATLYVTTYYVQHQTAVFNMLLAYLFWGRPVRVIDLSCIDRRISGFHRLADATERNRAFEEILSFAEANCNATTRQELIERIANLLGYDVDQLAHSRMFMLLDERQLKEMAENGIDIQLHTHRHVLPEQCDAMKQEIAENRKVLSSYGHESLEHLCYPSGRYVPEHLGWLREIGIKTAATTRPGFNYSATPRLELRRFLDRENLHQIEFEAELSGFMELLRRYLKIQI